MFSSGKSECNLCSLFVEISVKSFKEISSLLLDSVGNPDALRASALAKVG